MYNFRMRKLSLCNDSCFISINGSFRYTIKATKIFTFEFNHLHIQLFVSLVHYYFSSQNAVLWQ